MNFQLGEQCVQASWLASSQRFGLESEKAEPGGESIQQSLRGAPWFSFMRARGGSVKLCSSSILVISQHNDWSSCQCYFWWYMMAGYVVLGIELLET